MDSVSSSITTFLAKVCSKKVSGRVYQIFPLFLSMFILAIFPLEQKGWATII